MTGHDHSGATPEARSASRWVVQRWCLWAILALVAGGATVAAADRFPIVNLELAWTVEQADDVTRGANLDTIRSAVLWDFAFILFYALALSTGALWARHQFAGAVGYGIGMAVAIGGVLAGVFDIVENLSMLGYINGWGEWSGWIALAGVVAVPKFLLAAIGVVYIATGGVLILRNRRGD